MVRYFGRKIAKTYQFSFDKNVYSWFTYDKNLRPIYEVECVDYEYGHYAYIQGSVRWLNELRLTVIGKYEIGTRSTLLAVKDAQPFSWKKRQCNQSFSAGANTPTSFINESPIASCRRHVTPCNLFKKYVTISGCSLQWFQNISAIVAKN